ncbi:hypothetical protein QR680_016237 [Steinernema hermaphroditum]|uniref:Uncharacterized protein n=1 Tax=Steinernema hermaphroditum TaxID=289476 RepID=A0AA39LM40_9BILA|nr:hypothetical protein QR680_016237 [Steinernema hermaphroditum]
MAAARARCGCLAAVPSSWLHSIRTSGIQSTASATVAMHTFTFNAIYGLRVVLSARNNQRMTQFEANDICFGLLSVDCEHRIGALLRLSSHIHPVLVDDNLFLSALKEHNRSGVITKMVDAAVSHALFALQSAGLPQEAQLKLIASHFNALHLSLRVRFAKNEEIEELREENKNMEAVRERTKAQLEEINTKAVKRQAVRNEVARLSKKAAELNKQVAEKKQILKAMQ